MLSQAEVVRLYGPWARRTPEDAVDLLDCYPGAWWVAGGWAIDAFAGTSREHGDLDIGIPRDELPQLISYLRHRLDAWAADGSLTPLIDGTEDMPTECGNVWLRSGGAEPWEYDVLLEHVTSSTWCYQRDPGVTRPVADVLFEHDGIAYLRPEVQLLLKAKHQRPKDSADYERAVPLLDTARQSWLADALGRTHPDHPWLGRLPTF